MEGPISRFFIIFTFALPFPLVMMIFAFVENIIMYVVLSLAISLLFSVIAGLVTRDETMPYFVSIVSWVVFYTMSLFPYQYTTWSNWLLVLLIGGLIGGAFGWISSKICLSLRSPRLSLKKITSKKILGSILSILVLAGFYLLYSHLEEVVIYLDEHSWLPTIFSIIVTSILAFFGRGYYERRKRKK